jgi:hypothetical protein
MVILFWDNAALRYVVQISAESTACNFRVEKQEDDFHFSLKSTAVYMFRVLFVVLMCSILVNRPFKFRHHIFFAAQEFNSALGRFILTVSRSHTIRHTHTYDRTPLNEWSVRRRGHYLYNTQQDIHALSRIRTCDPSNQLASDLRLRPHAHRDQPSHYYKHFIFMYVKYTSYIIIIKHYVLAPVFVIHLKYYYVTCNELIPHKRTYRVHIHLTPMRRLNSLEVSCNLQLKVES